MQIQTNYMCTLALDPDVANVVGLRYGKFAIYAKIKFHLDQIKIEFKHLY